jgi:hypothetical protein
MLLQLKPIQSALIPELFAAENPAKLGTAWEGFITRMITQTLHSKLRETNFAKIRRYLLHIFK